VFEPGKLMKIQEIRELSDEELQTELDRFRRHLFDVRAQAVTEKLADPSMLAKTKRDIARILTVQKQRRSEPARREMEA